MDFQKLLSNKFGPPVGNAPDGRAWNDKIFQLGTPTLERFSTTIQDLHGVETAVTCTGPNLTFDQIPPGELIYCAFNEPKNWFLVTQGMSFVGQIFDRVFLTTAVTNSQNLTKTVSFVFGSAFLFQPTFNLKQPQQATFTVNSGHYSNGLILPSNQNRVKTEVYVRPKAPSGVGVTDVVGFGSSQLTAQDAAVFALSLFDTFSPLQPDVTDFSVNIGSPLDGMGGSQDPFSTAFWPSVDGPNFGTSAHLSRTQLKLTIPGGEELWMIGINGNGIAEEFFDFTPGWIFIKEYFQTYE